MRVLDLSDFVAMNFMTNDLVGSDLMLNDLMAIP